MTPDYSLYLVTDNTPSILGDRNLVSVVAAAVEGGVTIVQLRDKTSETAELMLIAKQLHAITKPRGVPLIINDRVDVALAVGAEGVHIGQDDMDLATARRILGPDAIIGVTASTIDEAVEAAKGGANYLGVGTVYATPTKTNAKHIIGTSGVRSILSALSRISPSLPNPVSTVLIGGINASNAQRILYQSTSTSTTHLSPDGIAIVSAIMASSDPRNTSSHLLSLTHTPPPFALPQSSPQTTSQSHAPSSLVPQIPSLLSTLSKSTPLCHNITNTVVQNLAANIALSLGGSPIMSTNPLEAPDLAALNGSLVLNMGTVTSDALSTYESAVRAYNAVGGPVLFDPVGGGATRARREAIKRLMRECYFDVIKGNESEIQTVLGENQSITQRGVDSGPTSTLSPSEKGLIVKTLALRERCVVLMTGTTDYLSDGTRTFSIHNGHEYLGLITGSGCTLGTTIAAFTAVERQDRLLAVLAGVVVFELAAERAAGREDVKGPGTFVPAFVDEIYNLRRMAERGEEGWVEGARVESVDV